MQHAHRALTECFREKLNERGGRVLNIYPGRTNTPRIERLFAREGRSIAPAFLLQPEDIATLVDLVIGLPATVELTDVSLRPAKKSY
jgi:NADP-dependent 3-hydroxy acid dehydrogenase YdfG